MASCVTSYPKPGSGVSCEALELSMIDPTESSGLHSRLGTFPCRSYYAGTPKSSCAFARPMSMATFSETQSPVEYQISGMDPTELHCHLGLPGDGKPQSGKHLFRLCRASVLCY